MADDGVEDRQRDEELADDDPVAVAIREDRKDLHTALPGIVRSFDAATQTAKVQPALKRRWREAGFLPLPELVDCPVQFPGNSAFVVAFELLPGDDVWVVFSERAIDNWHHAGGVQEPSEYRLHDLSDGCVLPGVRSKPQAGKIANFPKGAIEVRTVTGDTVIRLKPGSVELGGGAGALIPMLDGVVHGRGVDPFTGAPYYALGNTSAIVSAKK